jgi:hypothetical protein
MVGYGLVHSSLSDYEPRERVLEWESKMLKRRMTKRR